MNASAVITLLLGLVDRMSAVGALLGTIQAESRDPTSAEWDAVMAADKAARDMLIEAINKAKAAAGTP